MINRKGSKNITSRKSTFRVPNVGVKINETIFNILLLRAKKTQKSFKEKIILWWLWIWAALWKKIELASPLLSHKSLALSTHLMELCLRWVAYLFWREWRVLSWERLWPAEHSIFSKALISSSVFLISYTREVKPDVVQLMRFCLVLQTQCEKAWKGRYYKINSKP